MLEERKFERLGGNKAISVDFRLISATNRPLDQFVRDTRFREDLYYRVNAFAIRLPSLRERQVDIPVLAQRFLARFCAAQGMPLDGKAFSREALDLMLSYHWPGNIRDSTPVSRAALSAPDASFALWESNSSTRRWPRHSPRATGCRRWRNKQRTHVRVSKRCSGTRRKRRACWKSAAHVLPQDRQYQLEREPRPATPRPRHR